MSWMEFMFTDYGRGFLGGLAMGLSLAGVAYSVLQVWALSRHR